MTKNTKRIITTALMLLFIITLGFATFRLTQADAVKAPKCPVCKKTMTKKAKFKKGVYLSINKFDHRKAYIYECKKKGKSHAVKVVFVGAKEQHDFILIKFRRTKSNHRAEAGCSKCAATCYYSWTPHTYYKGICVQCGYKKGTKPVNDRCFH